MVVTVETIPDFTQADGSGHVLQFTVTIRRTGQAIQGMIGDVQLHDVPPQFGQLSGLRANLHALFDGRRT